MAERFVDVIVDKVKKEKKKRKKVRGVGMGVL